MDATTARTHNIRLLVQQAGGPTEFGELIERGQPQVSQWISATSPKPIGNQLARHIEKKLGQEQGWLDRPHGEVATSWDDVEAVRDVAQVLHDCFAEQHIPFRLEEAPDLFLKLYKDRLAMRDIHSVASAVEVGRWIERNKPQGSSEHERASPVPSKGDSP